MAAPASSFETLGGGGGGDVHVSRPHTTRVRRYAIRASGGPGGGGGMSADDDDDEDEDAM
jgi:hypothetical protein